MNSSLVKSSAGLNLILDRWIPTRSSTAGSGIELVRPSDIAGGLGDRFELAWPRPDLRIACHELLVGLLATACPPMDEEAWEEWWVSPPDADALQAALLPFAGAFDLDGDGPRFCQDVEAFAGEDLPVERLLIDSPGKNTLKQNTDLLVKRDRYALFGRAAAAMAVYALQAFAPSGGAGHRTSPRGGGPLTTLVRPGRRPSLWQETWANVPYGRAAVPADLPRVFPWLAPTRRSDAGGRGTSLDTPDADRLQIFWPMPRRIRLNFRRLDENERCALTGQPDTFGVVSFRTKRGGVQYVDAARHHPLTPTYRPTPQDAPLASHLQPEGIGYRHWLGLVEKNGTTEAASSVGTFLRRRPAGPAPEAWAEGRLLCAGYDMDNAKSRAFIEVEMPLFAIDEAQRPALLRLAGHLTQGAREAANILRTQLRSALSDADGGATVIDNARLCLFDATEPSFWDALRRKADMHGEDGEILREWLRELRRRCLSLFDEAAPIDPLSPRACGQFKERQWIASPLIRARQRLGVALAGYGKAGQDLFAALGLPPVSQIESKERRRNG